MFSCIYHDLSGNSFTNFVYSSFSLYLQAVYLFDYVSWCIDIFNVTHVLFVSSRGYVSYSQVIFQAHPKKEALNTAAPGEP